MKLITPAMPANGKAVIFLPFILCKKCNLHPHIFSQNQYVEPSFLAFYPMQPYSEIKLLWCETNVSRFSPTCIYLEGSL